MDKDEVICGQQIWKGWGGLRNGQYANLFEPFVWQVTINLGAGAN